MTQSNLNLEQAKKILSESIGQLVIIEKEIAQKQYARGCMNMGRGTIRKTQRFAGIIDTPGYALWGDPRYGNGIGPMYSEGYITVKSSLEIWKTPWQNIEKIMLIGNLENADINMNQSDFIPNPKIEYDKAVTTKFTMSIGFEDALQFFSARFKGNPQQRLDVIMNVLNTGSLQKYSWPVDRKNYDVAVMESRSYGRREHLVQ